MKRILAISLLFWAAQFVGVSEEAPDNQEVMVFTMAEGDTLQHIASQYLGGPEFTLELLKFNQIEDPNLVGVGSSISVPLAIRRRALKELSLAEEELTKAVEAQAEKFAGAHYKRASAVLESARKSRQAAQYDQTIALAKLAVAQSLLASKEAMEQARVQQDTVVTALQGKAEVSLDKGKSWKAAQVGTRVPVGGRIRTLGTSRVELTAGDKSILRVQEASELEIQDYTLDRRDGKRNSKLRVMIGNILGEITPRENKESKYEIETGSGTIAVRGTALRAGATADNTASVAVLHGLTEFSVGRDRVEVPGNYGTISRNGAPPEKPYELLPPPTVSKPAAVLHTARQRIAFNWEAVNDEKLKVYRLEIAKDEDFNQVVQQVRLDQLAVTSQALAEGVWYWRMTSVDTNEVEGNPTKTGVVTIKKNMQFQLFNRKAIKQLGNRQMVNADNQFFAAPINGDNSIAAMEYRLDDGAFAPLVDDFQVKEPGKHVLEVVAIAADGERTAPQKIEFHVDDEGPEMNYEVRTFKRPETGLKAATITVKVEDGSRVDKIEYDIGNGWKSYTKPIEVDLSGNRKINWRSVDAVGNVTEEYLQLSGQAVRSSK